MPADPGTPEKTARIISVTVTYNPDRDLLCEQLVLLAGQVAESIIIDNASRNLSSWRSSLPGNATLVRMEGNQGLGAAQNVGIAMAESRSATHVLLLDQDSLPDPGMLANLLQGHDQLVTENCPYAALGPVHVDSRSQHRGKIRCKRAAEHTSVNLPSMHESDFLIASGSLIPIAAFKKIGKFNEGYFIDHVDTEWCLRAQSLGYRLFTVSAAMMTHSIGDGIQRVWLGRWRNISLHVPRRNYYMVRNTLLLLAQNNLALRWRITLVFRMVCLAIFFLLFAPPRRERFFFIRMGVRDGLNAKTGPAPLPSDHLFCKNP